MTLRDIDEIKDKLKAYRTPRSLTFQLVVKQVLNWAVYIINYHPDPVSAEKDIRRRIERLEGLQGSFFGAVTDAPRQAQINALKWTVNEYDLKGTVGPV